MIRTLISKGFDRAIMCKGCGKSLAVKKQNFYPNSNSIYKEEMWWICFLITTVFHRKINEEQKFTINLQRPRNKYDELESPTMYRYECNANLQFKLWFEQMISEKLYSLHIQNMAHKGSTSLSLHLKHVNWKSMNYKAYRFALKHAHLNSHASSRLREHGKLTKKLNSINLVSP